MIFDSDIFIWIQRGNERAADLIEKSTDRFISVQTYMELLQCASNKIQISHIKSFISAFGFTVLPFTENIGHRASIYIEEYTLVSNLGAGDALIAATATENNMVLVTGNAKHFRPIRDLRLRIFKP